VPPAGNYIWKSGCKTNFLRDVQDYFIGIGRTYFPGLDLNRFDERSKKIIEEIKNDLDEGFSGIKKLPRSSRFGVYVAYVYYLALFKKNAILPRR
jgi:phytoene/squalene synthetase